MLCTRQPRSGTRRGGGCYLSASHAPGAGFSANLPLFSRSPQLCRTRSLADIAMVSSDHVGRQMAPCKRRCEKVAGSLQQLSLALPWDCRTARGFQLAEWDRLAAWERIFCEMVAGAWLPGEIAQAMPV
jgi:hypothetical protein